MLGYLSLDIISSSELTVFLELCSRKPVHFSQQKISADKYLSVFSRQMEVYALLYLSEDRHTDDVICFSKMAERFEN